MVCRDALIEVKRRCFLSLISNMVTGYRLLPGTGSNLVQSSVFWLRALLGRDSVAGSWGREIPDWMGWERALKHPLYWLFFAENYVVSIQSYQRSRIIVIIELINFSPNDENKGNVFTLTQSLSELYTHQNSNLLIFTEICSCHKDQNIVWADSTFFTKLEKRISFKI